jgi:hypothetical protein
MMFLVKSQPIHINITKTKAELTDNEENEKGKLVLA